MKSVGYNRLSTAATTIADEFLFSGGMLDRMSSFPAANTRIVFFLAANEHTLDHSFFYIFKTVALQFGLDLLRVADSNQ